MHLSGPLKRPLSGKQKKEMTTAIEQKTGCLMAGIIGHVAIVYKPHADPEKRKIVLPE
jgi:RNA-binding protein YhbY